jgi:Rrf2 family iron-sulfur cluster assembly transcriptional regulator
MWLNSTAQNALRAVLYIAEHGVEGPVRVDDIATALDSPRNYLSKTLHALARAGILRSTRGPKGGFQLVNPADELSLAEVVGPFEPAGERRCLMGRANCRDSHPCLVHHRWSRVAATVEDFFGQTTVADLLKHESRPHTT